MTRTLPFLISVPHGGTGIPTALRDRLALNEKELLYYCDPETRQIFGFKRRVAASVDTRISRMAVDLNRPPLPLPGKDPDGVIKRTTIDGRPVYRPGQFPGMALSQELMREHYFPYHQEIDNLIDDRKVRIAFDCHSMLPFGSCGQNDAGKTRPLICLGNNGDRNGRAKKNSVITCPQETVQDLAGVFREVFGIDREVAINNPFSGGFITNAHYWRKGIPWVQIELNRSLYEADDAKDPYHRRPDPARIRSLRENVWTALALFWDGH